MSALQVAGQTLLPSPGLALDVGAPFSPAAQTLPSRLGLFAFAGEGQGPGFLEGPIDAPGRLGEQLTIMWHRGFCLIVANQEPGQGQATETIVGILVEQCRERGSQRIRGAGVTMGRGPEQVARVCFFRGEGMRPGRHEWRWEVADAESFEAGESVTGFLPEVLVEQLAGPLRLFGAEPGADPG